MKKLIFAISLTSVLIMTGCAKETVDPAASNRINVTFIDENAKSVLNSDKTISWETKDNIAIYDKTANNKFTYDATSKTFTGSITASSTDFFAIYPDVRHSSTSTPTELTRFTSEDESVVCTTYLPSCQSPRTNSFSQYSNMCACCPELNGDKLTGQMINLCAYLKYTITSSKINKVVFKSNWNKNMSGMATVTFNAGEISVEGNEVPYVESMLASTEASTIAPGTYYVSVIPGSYGKIDISMSDTDGNVYEVSTKGDVSLERNEVANLGTIDANLTAIKTDKLSLLYNFQTKEGLSNCPTAKGTSSPILSVNGVNYTAEFKDLYVGSGKKTATLNTNGYMITPAVNGYSLSQVILTFKGDNTNGAITAKICDTSSDSKVYSGCYCATKKPDGTSKKKYVLGTTGSNNAMYWAHILTFGKQSPGEIEQTISATQATANTAYKVINKDGGAVSLPIAIELIYDKAN